MSEVPYDVNKLPCKFGDVQFLSNEQLHMYIACPFENALLVHSNTQ